VAWSHTHQEFGINDHHYYSILLREAKKAGIRITEVAKWKLLHKFDTIVFNYPEKKFTNREVKDIEKWLKEGKTVIFTGFFKNRDNVADVCNSAVQNFGLKLNKDEILSKRCWNSDKLYPIAMFGEFKTVMPCTASISVIGAEKLGVISKKVCAAKKEYSSGKLYLIGTCGFWDNIGINLYNNLEASINLLKGEF